MAKDYADPVALLEFDPAGVVIRAVDKPDLLKQLDSFASSLKYYVDMMENRSQPAAPPAATQERNEEAAEVSPEKVSSNEVPTAQPPSEGSTERPNDMDSGGNPRKRRASSLYAGSCQVEDDEDEDYEDYEDTDGKKSKAKKTRKGLPVGKTVEKRIRKEHQEPKTYPRSALQEKLATSSLQHSVGLTRSVISSHYKQLGLSSPSVPVHMSVSMTPKDEYGGESEPSHLTFQDGCIDFSLDQRRNFLWRPKDGMYSYQLVSHLNPAEHHQEELPVFLSSGRERKAKGTIVPHLLHYVGHYQCVRFEKKNHVFDEIPRQAILEFKFVGFHKSLANKMAELAS